MSEPNARDWVASHDKIVGYLLNPAHPDGAPKARFFTTFGFRIERWEELATVLIDLARRSTNMQELASRHGRKYIVDGMIDTPVGRSVTVRTVWIADTGKSARRLVSAYPQKQDL